MESYLSRVNEVFEDEGRSETYDSWNELKDDLEDEGSSYRFSGTVNSIASVGFLGTGFYSSTSDLVQNAGGDELSTGVMAGALCVSAIPAYLARKHRDDMNQVDDVLRRIENREYDEESSDFAYEILECF